VTDAPTATQGSARVARRRHLELLHTLRRQEMTDQTARDLSADECERRHSGRSWSPTAARRRVRRCRLLPTAVARPPSPVMVALPKRKDQRLRPLWSLTSSPLLSAGAWVAPGTGGDVAGVPG
jgi:hypothetical protein